jgi:lipopolysaccharide transport system ATP-binding protein
MAPASDICLSVSGVSKKFSRSVKRAMVYGAYDLGLALLGKTDQMFLRETEFWALRDVSFAVKRGRSMGVVGPNGSGKTTLMRLIAGVLAPTAGHIRVNGRIAPMLALGAGFKPVLSGRENIFLNLSLLGVSHREIADRLEAIIDFAEIGEAIDAPTGTYSSGMVARLGFSCAVHTNPQVLIVDEVLSVGDVKFRRKCRNRINDLRRAGTSMLLVSHSGILIQALCDECLYLRQGKIVVQGSPEKVLARYESEIMDSLAADNAARVADFSNLRAKPDELGVRLLEVRFTSAGFAEEGTWIAGREGSLMVTLGCLRAVKEMSINVMITDLSHQVGETVQFMTSHRDIGWMCLEAGRPELRLTFPSVGLRPGTYRVKISLSQGPLHDLLDVAEDVKLIVQDAGYDASCLYFQPREWNVTGGSVLETAVPGRASGWEGAEKL